MPASTRRIYVDANVLLAYLGNETGRAEIVESLLDEARRSEIEIITSVLSIAEVAFGAQERDAGLTREGEAQIDTLWQPASPITLVDVRLAGHRPRGAKCHPGGEDQGTHPPALDGRDASRLGTTARRRRNLHLRSEGTQQLAGSHRPARQ